MEATVEKEKKELPEIEVLPLKGTPKSKDIIKDTDSLAFGRNFTDYMFLMKYKDGHWGTPVIKPYENFSLDPAALVFHYAQEIFEGMKAFRQKDGRVVLFRPDKNIERFNRSARRMCMPEVDPDLFMNALKKLVSLEKDWVPSGKGSLYIRPTYIATEAVLGVRPSAEYYFYIILSPSGPYFKEGFNPIKIYVTTDYVRATPGGTGDIKCGGNYAASLKALEDAEKAGAPQVLWLDSIERKNIEEVGAMNYALVKDGVVYTAPLDRGTILPGITRDSVLQICKDLDIPYKEEYLAIDDVIRDIENGTITESFGIGTAAVIAPVGSLIYKGKEYTINDFKTGPISEKLYKTLNGIREGTLPDKHGWIVPVE